MIELHKFQTDASAAMADRFEAYMRDPLAVTRTKSVPFYQNLSSITGSGKTLILADAIERISTSLPIKPIVLWLSKGKVVVMQTLANLSTGRYADLIRSYQVKPLLDATQIDVEDSSQPLLLVATVGKFNQKDKESGARKIYRVGLDAADESLWNLIQKRRDARGLRRHLIVVYDEGHNLSDQQTSLLMELEPDALLVASATLRIPEQLAYTIDRLKKDKGWKNEDFVVTVPSTDVVGAGLVKKHIVLGGYLAPMETCIDDLLTDMRRAEAAASALDLSFLPKAIYVSSTNTVDGVPPREDALRPFKERLARPILIWRHLVETRGVDPKSIAVYCDLKFDKQHPPPGTFNLFSGGDGDYDNFMSGNFRHIIFNLALQEGWDDAACCFGYVDKEMGSPDQVTQVIGRVLRQPGAQHYADSALNTAHFYIRSDEKGVIESIVEDVRRKISSETPEITLTIRSSTTKMSRPSLPPLKQRFVPETCVITNDAQLPIAEIVDEVMTFENDTVNTVGAGARMRVLQTIGTGEEAVEDWVDIDHSNRVTGRWIFVREIQKRRPKAVNLCDIEQSKFDVLVEYRSRAADHFREKANAVVDAFIEHSVIYQNAREQPYVVGPISINEAGLHRFKHAIHEGYSDLNGLELAFAKAIDKTKKVWCRNPSAGGFAVDLLDSGKTKQFKPDFLVWSDKYVVAIDPKGDHLIVEDSARKLLTLPKAEDGLELLIRLVTEGYWFVEGNTPQKGTGTAAYTVWRLRHGKLHPSPCKDADEAVRQCLVA